MRILGIFAGLIFLFSGLHILDKPAVIASAILQFGNVIGGVAALIGLVVLVIATDWEKTP